MKVSVLSIIMLMSYLMFPLTIDAKTVFVPDNIKVEKNAYKVTQIRKMSELEIYSLYKMLIIDDSIYILSLKAHKVYRLTFQGKVIASFGKKGQGPMETLSLYGISRFGDHIAVIGKYKVIICTKDLKYVKEAKLKRIFHDLILSNDNKIYFYSTPSYSNFYFHVYSKDFKYLKKFGIKKPGAKEIDGRKINFSNYKYSFDRVWLSYFDAERNGIWVAFRDRYDLRYYQNEKTLVDIKARKQEFSTADGEFSGVKVKNYTDFPIYIVRNAGQLYYFYKKGEDVYCDIFDIPDNYNLKRRLRLPYYYRIGHTADSSFYGFRYDEEIDDKILDKIVIDTIPNKRR